MSMTFVLVKGPMWLTLRDVYKRDDMSGFMRYVLPCMRNLSYALCIPSKMLFDDRCILGAMIMCFVSNYLVP